MKIYSTTFFILFFFITSTANSQTDIWNTMIGSAYTGNHSYAMLQRLCDEAGGRLVGSAANEKAMGILTDELKNIGCESRIERFTFPGWVRVEDEVSMTKPVVRKLRSAVLGYVNATETFDASVVFMGSGFDEEYKNRDAKGKIALVTLTAPAGKTPLLRYEAIEIAANNGAKAILFTNDHFGGGTVSGVSNFEGKPAMIPAFSITYEEGKWMERLIKKQQPVTVAIKAKSYCKELQSGNIVVTFPGTMKTKIVIGAHFDSWDVSQGAVDNGIGTAVLFDVARLLKTYTPNNYYTVELVWFNGEELGLWGAKKYMALHRDEDLRVVINMDMVGSPTGFNAMGSDGVMPFLDSLIVKLNGYDLKDGVANSCYTNSDHVPFMLAGIPTLSLQAHLDEEMYKYYHDLGDTFDKVSKTYLSNAAAVVSVLAKELANSPSLPLQHRSDKETIGLMKKNKIDERLKKQKEWPFKEQ